MGIVYNNHKVGYSYKKQSTCSSANSPGRHLKALTPQSIRFLKSLHLRVRQNRTKRSVSGFGGVRASVT